MPPQLNMFYFHCFVCLLYFNLVNSYESKIVSSELSGKEEIITI